MKIATNNDCVKTILADIDRKYALYSVSCLQTAKRVMTVSGTFAAGAEEYKWTITSDMPRD
ncbi:predicted protein [Brucella ceti B1/94]|uniref:Uncharacterized protein n=1 Tax=Brucella pinnipedialis M292/94/1 TaxID=520462 RepID=A0A0E1X2L3_9HYPH|nr:predicted protein [Brucella ceti B1/94]EEY27280.1 predicted protein [Brucella sp. F5/99]EEZ07831.1 predicted protein [Brucella ceti M490/95/1]EEZ30371.1 predicted protein [Brucella pinnipedialis M292/94/1]